MEIEDKIPTVKIEPGRNNKVIILIHYNIHYNQELIKKVKSISGIRWNPEGKYWEVPYEEGIISEIQNIFGENLMIDPYKDKDGR